MGSGSTYSQQSQSIATPRLYPDQCPSHSYGSLQARRYSKQTVPSESSSPDSQPTSHHALILHHPQLPNWPNPLLVGAMPRLLSDWIAYPNRAGRPEHKAAFQSGGSDVLQVEGGRLTWLELLLRGTQSPWKHVPRRSILQTEPTSAVT